LAPMARMDAFARLAVLRLLYLGYGFWPSWRLEWPAGTSFEFLFHYNRVAKKPHKTKAKQPASIGYCNVPGLRNPDGTSRVGNPATFLATHKIPDDVIRVGRRAAPPIARAHPAVFPVKLATEMITAYSDLGQIIYEPFCGSGTTIIAAQKTGRRCRAIELQPEYCDLAIRRIQEETGLVAVHAHSREWFEVPGWLEFVAPSMAA
jgi:DNA modification methylase